MKSPKIFAAAKKHIETSRHKEMPEEYRDVGLIGGLEYWAFIAGSNFALGEVRELLREAREDLRKIAEHKLTSVDKIYLIHNCEGFQIVAKDALKKIDDSGVLTEETIKPITKENEE